MKIRHLVFALAIPALGSVAVAADSPADLNDLEFAHVAYIADIIDIQYAHLALGISQNPAVREFAQTMIRDHEAVNDQALNRKGLTDTVRNWAEYENNIMPLPHPSPRNNIWLKRNEWFERDVLPAFKCKVSEAIG